MTAGGGSPHPLPARRPVAKTTAPGACAVELGRCFPLPAHRRGRDPRARVAPRGGCACAAGGVGPRVWPGRGRAEEGERAAGRGFAPTARLERRARGCRGLRRGGRARGSSRPGSGGALLATGVPFGDPLQFFVGSVGAGWRRGGCRPSPARPCPAQPCPPPAPAPTAARPPVYQLI